MGIQTGVGSYSNHHDMIIYSEQANMHLVAAMLDSILISMIIGMISITVGRVCSCTCIFLYIYIYIYIHMYCMLPHTDLAMSLQEN